MVQYGIVSQFIKSLKEDIIRDKLIKLAISDIRKVNGLIFKRMVEYLFADSGVQILLYKMDDDKTKQQPNQEGKTLTANKQRMNTASNTRRAVKRARHEAALLKM